MYPIRNFDIENEGQRAFTIWMKICWRTYHVNTHTCEQLALLDPAVCSQYIIVRFAKHERTHRRTHGRTFTLPSKITPFQLRWNSVKINNSKTSSQLLQANSEIYDQIRNNLPIATNNPSWKTIQHVAKREEERGEKRRNERKGERSWREREKKKEW